ncbi:Glycosyl transferase family 2 [Rhizobium sp. NFR07]|uniref:glycosyltransferase family 2 protein n=1 Tax=Rhizobium sp. NFR07 TaxID=1566262 RepID=UPI0008EA8E86|nr:glycosyltransferase family 2 protein [Rhizobium sp. NFR07]SFB23783.1 Glycosyl transferase family 2 [Rhizobium sp. NFR07]
MKDRLRTAYETWRITRRERRDTQDVPLAPAAAVKPLSPEDLPLVFVTHNDLTILPFFLRHYRRLGVTRFICVDDVSQDGTRDYLLAQPDVDLWTSPLRFGEARRGRRWREQLFRHYGKDRWYLNVDSDEFLLYDQWERQPLRALIRVLEREGARRLPSPMIDMYSGPGAREPGAEADMPWVFSNHFDGEGYSCEAERRGLSIQGGPRRRRFNEDNQLIKYPVIFWDDTCFFGSSLHRPLPYDRNFGAMWGALLHFKFFTNYREKIAEAAQGKQHYNDSEHYKAMMSELQSSGELELVDEHSWQFRDGAQLVDLGFMTKIDFER